MTRAEELNKFLQEYEAYVEKDLEPAHSRIKNFVNRWREAEYWTGYASSKDVAIPSPVRSIFTRIKRPEKVIDKIFLKPDIYKDGLSPQSFIKMHDCIGVRVIVFFLSNLPFIDRELMKSKKVEISKKLPPIAYINNELINRFGLSHVTQKEKENGYQSLHYVVRLLPDSKHKKASPWFEIQVRTMAQEIWSEMEHILAYKSERRTNYSAKRRFQILSREIGAIDERFNLLYEELVQNQENVQYENEDILNNENLPVVLSEIGVRCSLQDMNTTLNLLHCRGVTTVKALLEMASMDRIETIKNTYISKLGRPPTSFELISSLGALKKATVNDTNDINRISTHIEFSNYWNKFRKKFREINKNNPRTYE